MNKKFSQIIIFKTIFLYHQQVAHEQDNYKSEMQNTNACMEITTDSLNIGPITQVYTMDQVFFFHVLSLGY